jgi:uncharacterized protein
MPLSMFESSVPVFVKTLTNLRSILAKAARHAEAKKIDEATLLQARLYPDMLPFTRQVQIASDMARGGGARLAGVEPPAYEDIEKSFAELTARVDRTLEYLNTLRAAQFEGAEARPITRPVRGQPKTFTGVNYLQQFVLPNLFFHATIAYAILRHNGVELGKADFLGALD